jgi:hypothetical protein
MTSSEPTRAFDSPEGVPEIYADSINVGVGPYGVVLKLGLNDGTEDIRAVATVRMAPQLAYVLSRILIRSLANAGEQGLGYGVPKDVLIAAGLGEDEA